jgi:hypothetical protein
VETYAALDQKIVVQRKRIRHITHIARVAKSIGKPASGVSAPVPDKAKP